MNTVYEIKTLQYLVALKAAIDKGQKFSMDVLCKEMHIGKQTATCATMAGIVQKDYRNNRMVWITTEPINIEMARKLRKVVNEYTKQCEGNRKRKMQEAINFPEENQKLDLITAKLDAIMKAFNISI